MKVAIIGSGISGLTCGYYLHKQHDVTVFEANDYIGGHTATIDVEHDNQLFAVDTGFIVFNDRTYPNFMNMMNEIGVKFKPSQMSFSVHNEATGLEYNGHTFTSLFAQKRNWFNPKFYHFIWEILRFNRLAKAFTQQSLSAHQSSDELTLGQFLQQHKFSDYFNEHYILPMGAAIWSSTLADMRTFPLPFFLRFFLNHGLLDVVNRPQWYVIEGGSNQYISPLTKGFADHIHLNTPVQKVTRDAQGVLVTVNNETQRFDEVIFACHSDQALALLEDDSDAEQAILGDMQYQANEVVLHTDASILPHRKAAWASWNYRLEKGTPQERLPCLTYNMNILQHLDASVTFCVSLNSIEKIKPSKVLRTFTYHHPVFTRQSIAAQQRKSEINGVHHTWFCGAYWHNGFHEDGVKSALEVVEGLQARYDATVADSPLTKGAA